MLTLLLLLAAQAGPQTGEIKSFGDWAVACDNTRSCEMTSLQPGDGVTEEGSGYDVVSLSVARAAGPAGGFSVEMVINAETDSSPVSIRAEGDIVAQGRPRESIVRFEGAEAAKIVASMVDAKELIVADSADTMIGRVSLAGSSAALRFIDAAQGRAGTTTAAVARGTRGADAVPAPAPAPAIASVRPGGTAAPVSAALAKALFAESDCGSVYEGGEGEWPEIQTFALGGGKTLALVPCGSGAYNFSTAPYLLGTGKPVLAAFDHVPGSGEDSTPSLTNADFDPATGKLSSYSKGRGLGDCGAAEDYVWDGTRFRLIEARVMGECRGSVNWLRVWKATPAPR